MLEVACLCAEWCRTCVDYRPGFLAMAEKFHGTQLPIHAHLERLLKELFSRRER